MHGQTPTASERPVTVEGRDADIERPVSHPSPKARAPGRSPSVPAAASQSDGLAAAATEGGIEDRETTLEPARDDVSDGGHTPDCSQESHDTIELWSE